MGDVQNLLLVQKKRTCRTILHRILGEPTQNPSGVAGVSVRESATNQLTILRHGRKLSAIHMSLNWNSILAAVLEYWNMSPFLVADDGLMPPIVSMIWSVDAKRNLWRTNAFSYFCARYFNPGPRGMPSEEVFKHLAITANATFHLIVNSSNQ